MNLDDRSLVQRARDLLPGIAARVNQTERQRCLPPETISELLVAGLLRSLQEKRYGGLEAHPADFFEAVIEVSAACPSTGWVLAVMGVHPFELAQMPPKLQDEILGADPDALIASAYALSGATKRVRGGFMLSGRWKASSGVDYAQWVVVGGHAVTNMGRQPIPSRFYVPRSDIEVVDDWFVMGLEGTGSKSISIDDAFVPAHRVIARDAAPDLSYNDSTLFRLPKYILYLVPGAAPAIGAAKGFFKEYLRQLKPRLESRGALTDAALTRIGHAKSAIDGEERRVLADLREMYALVEANASLSSIDYGRFVDSFSRVGDTCIEAVGNLFETLGAGAIYRDNPLQRYYRDLLAIRQHGTQDADKGAMAYGKALVDSTD